MNPYEILNVAEDATLSEIKFSYKAKAQRLHPDKKGGSHEKFAELQEAYSLLKNSDDRAHYDRFGAPPTREPSLDEAAVSQIMHGFSQWVGAVVQGVKSPTSNCLKEIEAALQGSLRQMGEGKVSLTQSLAKVEKLLGKFTVDNDSVNLFEGHLQSLKLQIEHQSKDLETKIKTNEAALELLGHFTYSPEGGFAPPVYASATGGAGSSTFTSNF